MLDAGCRVQGEAFGFLLTSRLFPAVLPGMSSVEEHADTAPGPLQIKCEPWTQKEPLHMLSLRGFH